MKNEHNYVLNNPNNTQEVLTRYQAKLDTAHKKARDAANASNLANRRAKMNFFNTVNATMNNHSVSAKKKFSILLRLMKSNKFSGISPLNENNDIIRDPKTKSEIFSQFFASKSRVSGSDDNPPILEKNHSIPNLTKINTSPIEVGRFIRGLKKSHISPCGISGKFLQLIS